MIEIFAGEEAKDFIFNLDDFEVEGLCSKLDEKSDSDFYVQQKNPDSSTISSDGVERFKFSIMTEKEFVHKYEDEFPTSTQKEGNNSKKVVMITWLDVQNYDMILDEFFRISMEDIRIPSRYYEEIGDYHNMVDG